MKTQVFYGEYSLAHWVELLKSGNIEIPNFQRDFEWDQQKIQNIILSFHNEIFVPPITIIRNGSVNFILDGQQRLTSILLAREGKLNQNIWKFKKGIDFSDASKFTDFDYFSIPQLNSLDKSTFFDNTFLGFSFIVLDSDNNADLEQFMAKVFYTINTQGVELKEKDKLKAYETITPQIKNIIQPNFEKIFRISKGNNSLIRLLGYVLQYQVNSKIYKSEKLEDKANIIESISTKMPVPIYNKNRNKIITHFNYGIIFNNLSKSIHFLAGNEFDNQIEKILKYYNADKYIFKTIAEFDLVFLGFLHEYLFTDNIEYIFKDDNKIKKLLDRCRNELGSLTHSNAPNDDKFLLERMEKSLKIYEDIRNDKP